MLKCKKVLCALLGVVMLFSVMACGCSTPAIAATIDGQEYTTGEYLAYLYNTFASVYQQYYYTFYYYGQQGIDYWTDMPMTYGTGDQAKEMNLSEYIIQTAQDNMIYCKALENKLKEFGLSYDATEKAEMDEQLATLPNNAYIQYGFNNEHYRSVVYSTALAEYSLFYGLYDKGGTRAMSEEDIRAWFNENILSYKIIELPLTVDGADMSEEQIKAVADRLEGYRQAYVESEDFDAVIHQFEADEKALEEAKKKAESGESDDTEPTAEEPEDPDEGDEDEEEEEHDHRVDLNAANASDEDLVKAIQSVSVGEAKIVNYKKGGSTNTAALILRLDPEADREEGVDYYADKRREVIAGAKQEEFQKEMKEYAATLSYQFDKSAVKACQPRDFEQAN